LASALCIIFLSPQLWRFHGHFALAYVCFLPLLYLLIDLLIRQKSKRWLWGLLCGFLIIVMSLTHMYFLLITLVFLSSFTAFWWWYNRKEKKLLSSVLVWLGGILIIPIVFLMGLRQFTDHVKDRPIEPYGMDVLTLTFESTFFSFFPPFDKTWTTLFKTEIPNFEKIDYTGLIGLLMLPAVLFFLFRKRDDEPLTIHVKAFLGAAIISWMMAAGVFYQNGFKFLLEILPPLKQFRSLGRIGLSFYYLYMVVCSYLLWKFYIRMRNRELGGTSGYVLGIIFIVWGFEAYLNMKAVRDPVFHENIWMSSNKDAYTPLLTNAGHKPEEFQAILQLPLVSIGNETVGVARGFWTMREGIHASIETGLPMMDYAMSRTSVSQGLDIIELISSPYFEKRRAKALDDRPILLLCEEEFIIPAERKLIDRATKIGTYQSMTLYSLPASVLKTISIPVMSSDNKDVICRGWYKGFEENICDTSMTGQGALPILSAPFSIWSYTDTVNAERKWELSFWSHVDNKKGNVPVPRMMETDPKGVITSNTGLGRESIAWAEAYGEWIQVAFSFTTLGTGYKYELFIDNVGPVIDNLLIRPVDDTCVLHFPGMILYNNLPIPVNPD
jgi:hypothetical protein